MIKKQPRILSLLIAVLVITGCQKSEPPAPLPPPPPPAVTPAPAASSALPPGHPPIDLSQPTLPAGTAALPPGHPPIDMSQQTLPPGTTAQVTNPQWTVPAGWEAAASSPIRRASFAVRGEGGQLADIAVTAFPGDVGGMLANINRWRGQIGLAPVTETELAELTTTLDVNGIPATVVDLVGDPQRMVVVILPQAGNSWFFKMTGTAALVENQKPVLLEFVESVRF